MQSVNAASKPMFFRLGTNHNVLRGDEHRYKQLSLRQFKSHMCLYQLMMTLYCYHPTCALLQVTASVCSYGTSTYVSDGLRKIPRCMLSIKLQFTVM